MRASILVSLLAGLLLTAGACTSAAETVAWANGRWFDGQKFVEGQRYSRDGIFLATAPANIDRTLDLKGGHIVPAFGDAHHHGVDSAQTVEAANRGFLQDGIYYVKNPNVIPDLLDAQVRTRLTVPDTIDVAFSNGGLTGRGGHPVGLHEWLSGRGVFPGLGPEDMENRAYFIIEEDGDLDVKWPRILEGDPDFIKAFVLFADAPDNAEGHGKRNGLRPERLREIVARAHAAGLRVSAHVETASDFRIAVEAGVDEINHLPLPDQRVSADLSAYLIDEATATLAAERGVVVVATASTRFRLARGPMSEEVKTAIVANQRANLATLRRAGVRIAIGSDGISGESPMPTGLGEVRYLRELGLFDDAELLRMWGEITPQTIFPKRRIGRLETGYEANFLVLDGDPLTDFEAVTRIVARVKQGREITL